MRMRIGQGFDAHPLQAGRILVLGGVTINHSRGLAGDSDGDVLTHAIMDAILGALSLGDLGTWFRSADPSVKGARSVDLLLRVMHMVKERHFGVVHVDSTVVAERPKLRSYVPLMRDVLAPLLGAPAAEVSIKATTTDQMGWIGRKEGMAALAIVQLESRR